MDFDPTRAVPRNDLGFLRRRSAPRNPAPVGSAPATPAPAVTTPHIDYSHHASAKPATGAPIDYSHHRPSHPSEVAPPARPKIDFGRPDRHPVTPATSVSPGPSASPTAGSLDLSDAPSAASSSPPPEPLPRHRGPRVAAGQQLLLGSGTPAVTLSRVQSGVGRLTVQAVCSPEVGDLRLGALYQLRSGGTSTVQLAGGNRFAPSSRRPVIVASHDEYDELGLDLRQIRDLERVTVYAFSESRAPLTWGGTLVVTTYGGARIEAPLESLAPAAVAVLVSLYNLDGELVVRTEFETVDGDIREAARAYGYDRITWRDERSPID